MAALTGQELIAYGETLLGVPYVYGGSSSSGVDCSGLMWLIARHFGINIPRTSNAQLAALQRVDPNSMQVGDLVFFDTGMGGPGGSRVGSADHVGMYVGNGNVLVADHTGTPVRIRPITSEARVSGIGRINGIVNTGPAPSTPGTTPVLSNSNLTSANQSLSGANHTAVLPAARPTFDMWGSLGLQSPNAAVMNENYGLSAAFIESDPELADLYSMAVAGNWSTDMFVSHLQNTSWWQKNSDSARRMIVLQATDPAGYTRQLNDKLALVKDQAVKLGVSMSDPSLRNVASVALVTNMNDAQINGMLSKYLQLSKDGHFTGYAGQVELGLREYARDMGVPLDDTFVSNAVTGIVAGTDSLQARRAFIQTTAENTFPAFREQIKQGWTVGEIATPYLATQAQIWEVDPNKIDLFDHTLRSALIKTDDKGKPAPQSLDQFQVSLRQHPNWLKTNNAREGMMATAKSILSSFGLGVSDLGAKPQSSIDITANSRLNFGSLSGKTDFPTLQGQSLQNTAAQATAPTGAGAPGGASFTSKSTLPSAASLAPDNSFKPTNF